MTHAAEGPRPRVFLSFAGCDRTNASLLADHLRLLGFEPFGDWDIEPGRDVVLAINDELTQSDYFVLLWSKHTADRPYVSIEWSTALVRDIQERRSFLFVVRLDAAELPRLLAPRKYLDLAGDWHAVAQELAAVWRRDRAIGTPVLPAPVMVPAGAADPNGQVGTVPTGAAGPPNVAASWSVYVRNRAMRVAHVVAVPTHVTGAQLYGATREALALPNEVERFGGTVGIRFYYRLIGGYGVVPDEPVVVPGLIDCAVLDLEIEIEPYDPGGSFPRRKYRAPNGSDDPDISDSPGGPQLESLLSPALIRAMISRAMHHLIPQRHESAYPRSGSRRRRRTDLAPGR